MIPTVSSDEAKVLEALVHFANAEVQSLDVEVPVIEASVSAHFLPGPVGYNRRDNLQQIKQAQQKIRSWMSAIASAQGNKKLLGPVLFSSLGALEVRRERMEYAMSFTEEGWVHAPILSDIETFCAFGLSLLVDRNRAAGTRLRQCPAPGCGKFHISLSPRGRPVRFCSTEHSTKYFNSLRKRKEQPDGSKPT